MKKIVSFVLLFNLFFLNTFVIASESISASKKYPCYSELFLNEDKHEKMNRKIFTMNLKANKYIVRNIHILWASIFPKFVITSLNSAYSNIEYPKRLVSSILQKDIEAIKNETKRFLINTTLGLGGLIDFARMVFKLEMYNEDMEQALAKCKMKCGSYLVLPFISSTNTRDILGRILDFVLNPSTYIASPIAAALKMGLLINRTAHIQPMIQMVESSFVDPYDIAKKFYGVEKYIKLSNYDRKNVIENIKDDYDEVELVDNQNKEENLQVKGKLQSENLIVNEINDELGADIILANYNPQNPVLDSMRTALFDLRGINNSFWDEISIWNRSFVKKIKKAQIEIAPNRQKYTFKYILQKDKNSPLAILFPSVGEGVGNSHNAVLAKIFYDEGYSVLMFGSCFQWEFLKSIEKGHKLGCIKDDIKFVNTMVNNAISYISKKYDRVFLDRIVLGTSFGAYTALFLANSQYEFGGNNIDKFIAICPPYELLYAMEQMDKVIDSWRNYPDDFKNKVAQTTAKVMRIYNQKQAIAKDFSTLPFSAFEAKLISAFVFHQKISDLVFAYELDNNPMTDRKNLYESIYNINYNEYVNKYFLTDTTYDELKEKTSVKSISNYLINKDNYKIYHSLDDYLINKTQLKELKSYCDNKLVLFNNGAHLGFLYRDEFVEELKKEIKYDKNRHDK